jgi:hypothetical protein
MYLQKVISRNIFSKLFFVCILKANDENSRIRIQDPNPDPDPLVRGSGSTPKCHGSAALVTRPEEKIPFPRLWVTPNKLSMEPKRYLWAQYFSEPPKFSGCVWGKNLCKGGMEACDSR